MLSSIHVRTYVRSTWFVVSLSLFIKSGARQPPQRSTPQPWHSTSGTALPARKATPDLFFGIRNT